ncbi:MAG: tRNA epoxyqueuosine(34) reductase QueG [Acidimicrobiales bacterium]
MATTRTDAYRDQLLAHAVHLGFAAVGVTTAAPFDETRVALETRRDAGLASTMQFTYRNPTRATTPTESLPDAASLVVGAWPYGGSDPAPPTGPVGRIARFARGNPYAALRGALDTIAERLRGDGHRARVLMDDNALVDRAAAHRAGLGWWGKNTNLLIPDGGSWHLLGSVLTDLVLAPTPGPVADGCGTCRRCLDACPTGALGSPGVLDARKCLTWLLQARGDFPREYRVALGDRLYGCDDCQTVCPPSRSGLSDRSDPDETWVDVLALLALDDDELLERVGHWYIPGRQARYVRRNLLVVLGNAGDPADARVALAIEAALTDDQAVVRSHAVWAARRLGLDPLLAPVVDDPDPAVQRELDAAMS